MSRKHVFGATGAVVGAAGAGCILASLACSSITPNPLYTGVYVPPGDDGSSSGDDSGGEAGDDGGATYGNCPAVCSQGTNCCLIDVDAAAGLLGTCQTPSACSAAMGTYIPCGSTPDTVDCPAGSTVCCLSFSDSGQPSAYCAASCPAGTPYACNSDPTTCPPGTNWECAQIPGSAVPMAALGECVVSDAGADGGTVTDAETQHGG
jgi:hypothetical protein